MTQLEDRKKMYAELLERGNALLPKAIEMIKVLALQELIMEPRG